MPCLARGPEEYTRLVSNPISTVPRSIYETMGEYPSSGIDVACCVRAPRSYLVLLSSRLFYLSCACQCPQHTAIGGSPGLFLSFSFFNHSDLAFLCAIKKPVMPANAASIVSVIALRPPRWRVKDAVSGARDAAGRRGPSETALDPSRPAHTSSSSQL